MVAAAAAATAAAAAAAAKTKTVAKTLTTAVRWPLLPWVNTFLCSKPEANQNRIPPGGPDPVPKCISFLNGFFVTYSSWRELEWFPLFPEGSRIGTPLVPCTWPPAVTKNWKPRNHRLESPGRDQYPSRVWNPKQNMFFDCGIIGDIWTNINICCEHSFQGWHITARFSTPKQKFNFLGKCTAKCQIQMQLFSDFR